MIVPDLSNLSNFVAARFGQKKRSGRKQRRRKGRAKLTDLALVGKKQLALIGVVVVAVGLTSYFYWQWQRVKRAVISEATEQQEAESEEEARREVEGLVEEVNSSILLPQDETPTVVVIDDTNKISSNFEFFQNAEKGDKVLIYRQAQMAYLYRPSEDRLINVARVNFSEGQGAVGGTATGSGIPTSSTGEILVVDGVASPSAVGVSE